MATNPTPKPPVGFGNPGKELWKAMVADIGSGWRLDARDIHLLGQAFRIEDQIRDLEAVIGAEGLSVPGSRAQATVHPCLAEARQLRLLQPRLLGGMSCAIHASAPPAQRPPTLHVRHGLAGRRLPDGALSPS